MATKTEELIKLIKENSDLPVVPMVDAEIAENDSGYWLGSWQGAYIGKYILHEDYGIIFYDEKEPDIVGIFEKFFDYEKCGIDEELPDSEALPLMRNIIDTLNWTRAIVVYIVLPEREEIWKENHSSW